MDFRIDSADVLRVSNPELSELLTGVYVSEGFTAPELAGSLFAPAAVRARGHLLCARARESSALAGMVIVVRPDAPARRLARADEAEMHLLAVRPEYRRHGLGRVLVASAVDVARASGYRRMVLWTQPTMTAAQALYTSAGFARAPGRDPSFHGRRFLAYEATL